MIFADGNLFLLQTANVSYLFRKKASGHLEHVHFGGSLISKYNYKKAIAAGKLEDAPHFRGHESYEWDSRIPKFYSVETIWGDSALAAVKSIDPGYLKYYRSETLIYRCLRRYPKYKTEILHNYKANGGNRIRLGSYGLSRLIVKVKCKLLRTKNSEIKITKNDLQNIEEASRICETWIAEHKESTSFENEYTVR